MSDTVIDILTAANVRLGQKNLPSLALTTVAAPGGWSQPATLRALNTGFRKMQERLAALKYQNLEQTTLMTALPFVTVTDPSTFVRIDSAGYFDGTNNNPSFALPANFIRPYALWERFTSVGLKMYDLDEVRDGLAVRTKTYLNKQWEWVSDAITMPGALNLTDLLIRYAAYFADFADSGTTPWIAATVPIPRCLDSFSNYVCCEVAQGNGNIEAAVAFQLAAENAAEQMIALDTRSIKFGLPEDR